MGTETFTDSVSPFPATNIDTLNPWLTKPSILLLINVSEYPGKAGNTRPIFNLCNIKRDKSYLDNIFIQASWLAVGGPPARHFWKSNTILYYIIWKELLKAHI